VVFATPKVGWLYGPGLWVTRDGGARWRRTVLAGISPSPGGVSAMAAAGGTVYAVVSPGHDSPQELYASPVGQDAWARVGHLAGDPFASLAVSGTAAWFATSTRVWATTGGGHWHRYRFSCPGSGYGLAGIAAASRSDVDFLCTDPQGMYQTGKEVLRSVSGGRTERLAGSAPVAGDTYADPIASPPGRGQVITLAVVSPGPSALDWTADGGRTWTEIPVPSGSGGGTGVSSLSYVSRTTGWVIAGLRPRTTGGGPYYQLLRTTDAGLSWHHVSF